MRTEGFGRPPETVRPERFGAGAGFVRPEEPVRLRVPALDGGMRRDRPALPPAAGRVRREGRPLGEAEEADFRL